ncbi:MAG: nuclear transport factor 2 family protein [Caulobacteraceae bacterium]
MSINLNLAAIAFALVAGRALVAPLPPDLARAATAYDQAQIKGDRAALERLLADDYTLVNSAGRLETKAQLIADYTAPGYRLDPFIVLQPVEKVWADGAVLGGLVTVSGVDGGKPYAATLRFADVWARRGGRWRVIFTQVAQPPAK